MSEPGKTDPAGFAPAVRPALAPTLGAASHWGWSPDLNKGLAYERILFAIVVGDLAPGERLDEQALVTRYGVGLAGVRDALGRLALENLVVRRPRAGTTVASLDLLEMDQVFEARRLIEPPCAALAARHATPSDLHAMRAAFADAEAAITARDSLALVAMDQRFHAAVVRASRNATLVRIAIPLQHKATRFWVHAMGEDTPEQQRAEIKHHLGIADHIAKGDANAAREAMLATLSGGENIATPTARSKRRR